MRNTETLDKIERNIREHGFHVYLVSGGLSPRFAYTIGLRDSAGMEVVFAGGVWFQGNQVSRVIDVIARGLLAGEGRDTRFLVDDLGAFCLRESRDSWARRLILGAFDFYEGGEVPAWQIVPDATHLTLDVPDLTRDWDPEREPVWQWLEDRTWPYSVPAGSIAATDILTLRGGRITEVARWEVDEWEIFAAAGPEVDDENVRIVPLAMLLAADPSLRPAVDLEIGEGLRRDSKDGDWIPWRNRSAN